ncbi:hypothetical protein FTX61_17970 [Nitriliruptoraceae bacterium ZYF776]|nr:hypothetical protein [Profundirhabdus halotolerans]
MPSTAAAFLVGGGGTCACAEAQARVVAQGTDVAGGADEAPKGPRSTHGAETEAPQGRRRPRIRSVACGR